VEHDHTGRNLSDEIKIMLDQDDGKDRSRHLNAASHDSRLPAAACGLDLYHQHFLLSARERSGLLDEAVLEQRKQLKGPWQRIAKRRITSGREAKIVAHRKILEYRLFLWCISNAGTDQQIGSLTGRIAPEQVARALMVRPRLLLIDEISEGLQPSVIAQIAAVLRHERNAGTAILLIEQNVAFALAIADRWAVFKRGAIEDQGTIAADSASRIAEHFAM
jgi:ABC-type uncharacterized transport system ATPase subunit